MVAAYNAQSDARPSDDMWAGCASNFKPDSRAPLTAFADRVASFLSDRRRLLDVGGGSGTECRCRSRCAAAKSSASIRRPGMADVFETSVRDAGITQRALRAQATGSKPIGRAVRSRHADGTLV